MKRKFDYNLAPFCNRTSLLWSADWGSCWTVPRWGKLYQAANSSASSTITKQFFFYTSPCTVQGVKLRSLWLLFPSPSRVSKLCRPNRLSTTSRKTSRSKLNVVHELPWDDLLFKVRKRFFFHQPACGTATQLWMYGLFWLCADGYFRHLLVMQNCQWVIALLKMWIQLIWTTANCNFCGTASVWRSGLLPESSPSCQTITLLRCNLCFLEVVCRFGSVRHLLGWWPRRISRGSGRQWVSLHTL